MGKKRVFRWVDTQTTRSYSVLSAIDTLRTLEYCTVLSETSFHRDEYRKFHAEPQYCTVKKFSTVHCIVVRETVVYYSMSTPQYSIVRRVQDSKTLKKHSEVQHGDTAMGVIENRNDQKTPWRRKKEETRRNI